MLLISHSSFTAALFLLKQWNEIMHGSSAESFPLHGRNKNGQHAQNSNQNQKGPDFIYMLSIWCTFGKHTVFAKLEGAPMGGRGLIYNLGLKEVTQSGFPVPTLRKLNSWQGALLLECKETLEETNMIKIHELIILCRRAPKHRFGRYTLQIHLFIHSF